MFPKIVELNAQGMTIADAAAEVGVHPATVTKWQRQTGVKLISRKGNRSERDGTHEVTCDQCGKVFVAPRSQKRRFCSRECTNEWQRAQVEERTCEGCGKPLKVEDGATTMYTYRKFCSKVCRMKYGKKRQRDPANYVTFNCETCGKEVTRYKGHGSGHLRFCSNLCAAKHTKKVRHYVVREADMVLDSTWEMLFAGLMGFLKIPCERNDREYGVEYAPDHWYAPDFLLSKSNIAIEVKGNEDDDDPEKWELFRAQRGPLAVVDQEMLETLRMLNREQIIARLHRLAEQQGADLSLAPALPRK